MRRNLNSLQTSNSFSIVNILQTSTGMYLTHFKLFFYLSLSANLWLLIPIYGWAKYFAIRGIISRIVFNKMHQTTEPVNTTRCRVEHNVWQFLMLGAIEIGIVCGMFVLSLGIISFLLALGAGVVFSTATEVPGYGHPTSSSGLIVLFLAILFSIILAPILSFWFYSRFLLGELHLAIEGNLSLRQTIQRSWQLSKGRSTQIAVTVFCAFLLTYLLILLVNLSVVPLVKLILHPTIETCTVELLKDRYTFNRISDCLDKQIEAKALVENVALFVARISTNMLLMPFWQALKAVWYYKLINVFSRKSNAVNASFPDVPN
jgi:hypothetical protein